MVDSLKGFNIDRFADAFKNAIEWMLKDEHGNDVENEIKSLMENKRELELNPDSPKALKRLVEIMITQAWYYNKPLNFDEKMNTFINKVGTNFRTQRGRRELFNLISVLAPPRIRNRVRNMLEELLEYPSIRRFTEELYQLAMEGKTKVLGEKGRDNYLRDFGYWDRVPIDRHEMRFIVRTGIYHACSLKTRSDPLQKASLHDALTRFCSNYLKGYRVFDIDLGDAPGIVDVFIWYFCRRRGGKGYGICRRMPKCEICPLKETCLYAIVNISTH